LIAATLAKLAGAPVSRSQRTFASFTNRCPSRNWTGSVFIVCRPGMLAGPRYPPGRCDPNMIPGEETHSRPIIVQVTWTSHAIFFVASRPGGATERFPSRDGCACCSSRRQRRGRDCGCTLPCRGAFTSPTGPAGRDGLRLTRNDKSDSQTKLAWPHNQRKDHRGHGYIRPRPMAGDDRADLLHGV
jgi:hypothetical protein